jgi:hypothetical protein
MAARTLINVPQKARRGDVIQIKSLISHIMESDSVTTMAVWKVMNGLAATA